MFLVILSSCTGNKMYNQLLTKADSLMNIDDDSARIAIQMLDEVKPKLSDLTRSQKMRYELLYHKAMNKADSTFTSDSIMLEVVDYYEHHGSANDRMLAYYVLGCVYRDMHEAPLALEFYNKATEQADTTDKDCDYATLCRVYSQMGVLFDKQYLPYEELASFDKATLYAYKAQDTLNAIRYYENKIGAYTYLNNEDSAIIINTKAAELFRKHGYNQDADIAFGCNYGYYVKRKNKEKAKKAFEAYTRANYMGNTNYVDSYAFLLYEKGMFYLLMEQNDSAHHYLQNSLMRCKTYGNKVEATKGLALYYTKVNNSTLAAKYALLSSAYNDSDLVATRHGQLQQVQAMYDYNRNKELANKAQLRADRRMKIIYIVAICAILVFIVSSSIYRRRMQQRNQRIAIVQKMYNDSVLQLNVAQQELAKLQCLKENIVSTLVKEKEEAIQRLQLDAEKYKEANVERNLLELEKQLKQSPIYHKLVYLENHPQEKMTKADWINLEETVEKLVSGFAGLKQKLNAKEYRICLLVKLRFSPSTISTFVGTSLSDISNSRRRMLAKICGSSGKGKEFDDYIHHIL